MSQRKQIWFQGEKLVQVSQSAFKLRQWQFYQASRLVQRNGMPTAYRAFHIQLRII